MASKIRILSEQTINKIAAGEVIENPASVVKELVENSLDAESKEICIEIKGGGRQLIRVSDDGSGMNADDALLCLERHATSKIRAVEELHSLSTMGFRGEALPSIASISKFTLLTCPADDRQSAEGTMVIVDGGQIISHSSAVRSRGTTIEVKNLFFNVPVRKKFLKSPAYDANEILKVVSLIAMGYPEVRLQLISDGKTLLQTALSQKESFLERFKERIGSVLGLDYLQNSVEIAQTNDQLTLQGIVGLPTHTRHNRTGQYLFINRRAVVSPIIIYALKEAYGTSLPNGRHPVFSLHLTIPGDLVDVNVHPQKREVRLRQEQLIKELIIKAVIRSLNRSSVDIPTIHAPVFNPVFTPPSEPQFPKSPLYMGASLPAQPPPQLPTYFHQPDPQISYQSHQVTEKSFAASFASKPLLPAPPQLPKILTTLPRYVLLDPASTEVFGSSKGGFILIDQKAAHARIIFEKLLETENDKPLPQQLLLIPHQLELSPLEAEMMRASFSVLKKIGFSVQEFGSTTFLVDAIPEVFGNSHVQLLMADILNELAHIDVNEQFFQKEKISKIALAASRAAVSTEHKLSMAEAESLINRLLRCQQPCLCPSGKPTFLYLSNERLFKLFQKNLDFT